MKMKLDEYKKEKDNKKKKKRKKKKKEKSTFQTGRNDKYYR